MKSQLKNLLIIDPYSLDHVGHLLECSLDIATTAAKNGIHVFWATQDYLKIEKLDSLIQQIPIFKDGVPFDIFAKQNSKSRLKNFLKNFVPMEFRVNRHRFKTRPQHDEFKRALDALTQGSGLAPLFQDPSHSIILMHAIKLQELEVMTEHFAHHVGQQNCVILVREKFFWQSSDGPTDLDLFTRQWIQKIFKNRAPQNLKIVSDSQTWVDEFAQTTGHAASLVPMPAPNRGGQCKRKTTSDKIHIGFLGPAHWQRGWDVVEPALKSVLCSEIRNRFVFHLQVDHEVLVHTLHDQVQIYPSGLSPVEYNNLFKKLDVILLPYSSKEFYGRSSGKFVEAYSAGKCCIVRQYTWLADQLASYGGGVILKDDPVVDLIAALEQIAKQGIEPFLQLPKAIEQFKEYHCTTNFLTSVASLCGLSLRGELKNKSLEVEPAQPLG